MVTEEIIKSIFKTRKDLKDISLLPDKQGIYAFFLNKCGDLEHFGSMGQVIYVGLSKNSLNSRETKTHMNSGQTGWSSFRRSLGAILKIKLNLSAQKRDKNSSKLRADKYKFNNDGEIRLTEWMMTNLKMGYWSNDKPFTLERLREQEKNIIIKLKPTLDLDSRTKDLNQLANELDQLRKICRDEVKTNIDKFF